MAKDSESRIEQAVTAAKAGKREESRQILLRVVRDDPENVRAWLLLARVTTNNAEKRSALTTVTELEPENRQAHKMLAELTISGVIEEQSEQAARTNTSVQKIILGVIGLMVLVVAGLIGLVVVRNNEQAAANAEQTEIAGNLTSIAAASTQDAVSTEVSIAETGTAIALLPTNTPTPSLTWTPLPTGTPTITPTASLTPIPSPEGLPGVIFGWGGSNALNDGYFPVVQISVDGSGSIIELSGTNRGELVTAGNRSRIFYTRFFRDTFDRYLSVIDTGTGQQDNMALIFNDSTFARATSASITPDGRLLVFVAETGINEVRQIYLYDFLAPPGTTAIRRVTNDEADYDFPAISPDGTKILAVRRARAPLPPGTDLILYDLSNNQSSMYTEDGDTTIETHPRWSPDGLLVAYVVGTQADPKGDIFIRTTTQPVSSFNITRTVGIDEIFPVFSPDSRYLAFSSDVVSSDTLTTYNIFIYDLVVSGSIYQLTQDDERFYPGAWVE
ncbi:MAG: hypothetical protein MUF38_16295 [Anaerolineae bacterium]|jgi:hypothetical protein|nr:hypothetical protein [Anaerolineae bacterium]